MVVYVCLKCDLSAHIVKWLTDILGRDFKGLKHLVPMLCSTQQSTNFQLLIKSKIQTNKGVSCFKSLTFLFIMLINVKMSLIVGILTFMSRINFVLR